jgi:hypothetical protein
MAGLAVGLTLMVEVGPTPRIGAVAAGALPAIVVGWFILVMTGLAVDQTLMAETSALPGARVMAL